MKDKGPLAILQESIAKMRAETYDGLRTASAIFAQRGNPRNWMEFDGSTPITWTSESDRERSIASYDEWITGAWNEIPGVVRPTPRTDWPLVS
jgi:hypothetical protein